MNRPSRTTRQRLLSTTMIAPSDNIDLMFLRFKNCAAFAERARNILKLSALAASVEEIHAWPRESLEAVRAAIEAEIILTADYTRIATTASRACLKLGDRSGAEEIEASVTSICQRAVTLIRMHDPLVEEERRRGPADEDEEEAYSFRELPSYSKRKAIRAYFEGSTYEGCFTEEEAEEFLEDPSDVLFDIDGNLHSGALGQPWASASVSESWQVSFHIETEGPSRSSR